MGSSNHFVEVQEVDEILDGDAARAFGLREQQVTVLIHSGSRGLGHQVCTDYVKAMDGAMRRYGIALDDRQLACAPASSPEGQSYLAAMAAAANFAWSNRQALRTPCAAPSRASWEQRSLGERVRSTTSRTTSPRPRSTPAVLCSCTARAPQERSRLVRLTSPKTSAPSVSRSSSPGAWGRRATCSPASRGRWRSHSVPRATAPGALFRGRLPASGSARELRRELEERGIVVRCPSPKGLAEEAPAYKDVERVVRVVEQAGLARRVARLVPLGVVKG